MRRSVAEPVLFSVVYERHLAVVARYAARRVGGGVAEDVVGEVFVRAFRARGSFRAHRETAIPWLLGIASRVIGDHRRAERRRLAALQMLASQATEDTEELVAGVSAELIAALRRLRSEYRDALLLVVWGELSYEEAAVALELPVGTVRSRIARARVQLARTMVSGGASVDVLGTGEAHG